jgi:hypothetical protein
MPSQNSNSDKYVVTCYYYCAGEPDDSCFGIVGCYSTHEEAEKAMMNDAEGALQDMKNKEEEKCEDIRKHAKDQNINMEETDERIYLKSGNNNISYKKITNQIKQGLRGLVVGNIKNDGDEDNFHYGGYDGARDFFMYNIQTTKVDE